MPKKRKWLQCHSMINWLDIDIYLHSVCSWQVTTPMSIMMAAMPILVPLMLFPCWSVNVFTPPNKTGDVVIALPYRNLNAGTSAVVLAAALLVIVLLFGRSLPHA